MAVSETERLIAELFDAIDDIKLRLTHIESQDRSRKAIAQSMPSNRFGHVIGLVMGVMIGIVAIMVAVAVLLVHVGK